MMTTTMMMMMIIIIIVVTVTVYELYDGGSIPGEVSDFLPPSPWPDGLCGQRDVKMTAEVKSAWSYASIPHVSSSRGALLSTTITLLLPAV
jgi:hypothetical protein